MILEIDITESYRTPQERERICLTFRNAVLDYYGGVERAKKSHDSYKKHPSKPFQDWCFAYHNAVCETRPLLSAWERSHCTFRHNTANVGTMDFIEMTVEKMSNRRLTYKELTHA